MTSDSEIQDILIDRIDTRREAVGIVVGVIDPLGRRVIAYGSFGKGDPRPLDGNTLFEVGSVTKVFTALLLTDMAERAEVAVNDPVAQYLPAGVTLPQRGGRQITLIDLATHTSGLPRLPPNFSPKDVYAALVGFDPRTHLGVVVLSNTFAVSGALVGVDDIGLHLLKPTVPLNRPSQQRTNISLDPEQIDSYVGQYRLLPTFVISVRREGTRLFAQATGQPRFEIFPESEREFFAAIGDIQIRFDVDERGRATLLHLRQGGEPFPPAPRIE